MVREHTTSCMGLYKSRYYILYDFLLKFNLNKISEILSEEIKERVFTSKGNAKK